MENAAEQFKRSMRRLGSGVCLITTRQGEVYQGLTATAVCSLSVDPPSLLVSIQKSGATAEAIESSGRFAVNVLSSDQASIARLFASRDHGLRAQSFNESCWSQISTGAPVLQDALACFDCLVERSLEYASHRIIIGSVVASQCVNDRDSLLYAGGQYGTMMPFHGDGAARQSPHASA
jgi:flavin reductase